MAESLSEKRRRAGKLGAAARWGQDRPMAKLATKLPSDQRRQHLKTARPIATLKQGKRDWYRIENKTGDVAEIFIYDEIGFWGITAQDFAAELREVTASKIDLRLNTPGGEVFDGIAIHNALVEHEAEVTVHVDALAASIGSVIAMAGDRIIMGKGAEMMIHDSSGFCIGNSADMRELADLLDRASDNIAQFYADRAGGSIQSWRDRMRAETWYSADEAVKAGLADEVAGGDQARGNPEDTWDLSIFNYAGRRHAPAPILDQATQPATQPDPEPAANPESVDDEPFAFDPDLFRTLVANVAEQAPAPPDVTPAEPQPDPFQFDPDRFRRSVMEALT